MPVDRAVFLEEPREPKGDCIALAPCLQCILPTRLETRMRCSLPSIALVALLACTGLMAGCGPQQKQGKVSAADIAEGAKAGPSSIDASVAELFPGAKPSAIAETAWPGVYEVIVNGAVYYADKSGRFFISGEMMQVDGKKNLTAQTRDRLRKDLMTQIDEKDAIIYKATGPKKDTLDVFTDVECGYCRAFHKHISDYNALGYEVHYYPWPRSGTSGPVYDEMVSVWCAKDRRAALDRAKSGDKNDAKTCDNPVAKYVELGRQMGIQGTPAVFLSDGKQLGGYVAPENMDAFVAAARDQDVAAR